MSITALAIASPRSFGDFVIVHSVLHNVAEEARSRVRLISCAHVRELHAVLPVGVDVTLLDSGTAQVPALFDVKKRGAVAAARSALRLRRQLDTMDRAPNESLAFIDLGVRERFIAGRWPVLSPRRTLDNIYQTYRRFLADHEIRTCRALTAAPPKAVRSAGIFIESRLAHKRIDASTLSLILSATARRGLNAHVFVLEGDCTQVGNVPQVVRIARDFHSLARAIQSVDLVISADSLPAHLGEYFGRPVFVASAAPNEYWLPLRCFKGRYWGVFSDPPRLAASLDRFLGAAPDSAGARRSANYGRDAPLPPDPGR